MNGFLQGVTANGSGSYTLGIIYFGSSDAANAVAVGQFVLDSNNHMYRVATLGTVSGIQMQGLVVTDYEETGVAPGNNANVTVGSMTEDGNFTQFEFTDLNVQKIYALDLFNMRQITRNMGKGFPAILVYPTDDVASIIASAAAGSDVWFAPGTYTLASALVIDKALTLHGFGSQTTFTLADGAVNNMIEVTGDNVIVCEVTFDGNASATATGLGVLVTDAVGTLIRDCTITDFAEAAFVEAGTADYTTVRDIRVL